MYQKILDVTWERLTEISVPTEQVNALDLQGLLSRSAAQCLYSCFIHKANKRECLLPSPRPIKKNKLSRSSRATSDKITDDSEQ